MRFLRSVVPELLPPHGTAATLTFRDCPSFDEFKKVVKDLMQFLRRNGVACAHYVVEWTKAGKPHLHLSFFEHEDSLMPPLKLRNWWLKRTACFGNLDRGQFITEMLEPVGFFQYASKHASRGLAHYQREKHLVPEAWEKTGRMWGKGGDWPVDDARQQLTRNQYFAFRRNVDRCAMAQAKSRLKKAIKFNDERAAFSARRSIKHLKLARKAYGKGRAASEVRGVNEWIDAEIAFRLLEILPEPDEGFSRIQDHHGLRFENDKFRFDIVKPDRVLADELAACFGGSES